jgi:hypothetical protein
MVGFRLLRAWQKYSCIKLLYHIPREFAKLPDVLFRDVGEVCKQDMAIRRPVMIVLKRRTHKMLRFPILIL